MSMTPEDRDLLSSLRRQQAEIQQSLEKLNAQLTTLEARAGKPAVFLPPIPAHPALPPIPNSSISMPVLPPIPVATLPIFPPFPSPPAQAHKPSMDSHFGRWLARIGTLLFVLFIVSFATWMDATFHIHERFGAPGKIGLMGLVSFFVVIIGQRAEQRPNLLFFGRSILAAGLAGFYITLYSAYFFEHLRIVWNPIMEGILLLWWSVYVFYLAEQRKSQLLALFSITLAYVGTAVNPVDHFTMAADLVLAATAVLFFLRNGWIAVAGFSLVGSYFALLHRLLIDQNGELILDTSRTLHFLPHAVYLISTWVLFTVAFIWTREPTFRGGKRLLLISLNNGGLASLLTLTAYIAGYGLSSMGWALLDSGVVFLAISRVAGFAHVEPVELMAAYAAQGLALVTAGVVVVFNGITRGLLLLLETFFLGIAAAFSGDRILTINTYVAGFFATIFLIWEVAVYAHHPWLFGFGGAAVMLINAWSCRSEVRHSPRARSSIVTSSFCYCLLAIGLIFTTLDTELNQSTLPPALALAALVLTFSIYYFSLFELPPLAQILLLAAQVLAIFPAETGEDLPWWSSGSVAAITLLLVTWWSRQRVTRSSAWIVTLTFIYALALVGLATQAVHPYLDAQGWMIGASLLSVAFLIFGAFTRVWSLAAMGQFFLVLALYHFFFPPSTPFPWAWWAAAVPLVVVFVSARALHEWLRLFPEIPEAWRTRLRLLAYGYQLLALTMLVAWIFDVVPLMDQVASFLFLGTLVLSSNVRHANTFGVRCSFVLSAIGMWLYFNNLQEHALAMATFFNGLAMLLFLSQATLLRHEGRSLVTQLESWTLIILSVVTGWIFVSAWVLTRLSPGYLTTSWALYALFLFLFGLLVWERRLRWCGLAVIITAILRVFFHDLWGLSGGYRVFTLLILTIITLGLAYVILRPGDRRQSWL